MYHRLHVGLRPGNQEFLLEAWDSEASELMGLHGIKVVRQFWEVGGTNAGLQHISTCTLILITSYRSSWRDDCPATIPVAASRWWLTASR